MFTKQTSQRMSAMCVLNKNLQRDFAVINLRTRKFVSFPRSLAIGAQSYIRNLSNKL